jgi:aubergine-like protein
VNAGTIIANDIVSEHYDFYLVSQSSNRGSTVPNHYKVVFTNSEIEEGLLHELIFSQCFNYVNWTGSIKIPGILQYTKKCAKFSSEALDGEKVKEDLESKLYFV